MKKITLIITCFIMLITTCGFAQVVNDNCSGAIPLTFGVEVFASRESSDPMFTSSCELYAGYYQSDQWYSFIAPVSGSVRINTYAVDTYTVYSDCIRETEVYCSYGGGENTIESLVSGNTYYIQIITNTVGVICDGPCDDYLIAIYEETLTNKTFQNQELVVYPNPVENILSVKSKSAITTIQVYNVLGKELLNTSPNALNTFIDLSAFNPGYYIVKLNSNTASKTLKVFKK